MPLDVKNGVESRFSEAVTRKSFLDPDSGVAVFGEAVTQKFFLGPDSGNSNIPLFFFQCVHKPYVMRYAGSLDVRCVRT